MYNFIVKIAFLTTTINFANCFYYSSGLCPKIQSSNNTDYKMPRLLEIFRFVDRKTLSAKIDQGFCTKYYFGIQDHAVVTTWRVCSDVFIHKSVSFFALQNRDGGGFSIRPTDSDEYIFGLFGFHRSDQNVFCRNETYFGNDNVIDSRIIEVVPKESTAVVVILWGCDQLNETTNKQKLLLLASSYDVRYLRYYEEVVENFINSHMLEEKTLFKYPILQGYPLCGFLEMNGRSSKISLRGSALGYYYCVILLHLVLKHIAQ